jgi:hypothetical protein
MVKQLIKEAMDKNPIGLKEALAEELKTRIALALEAKMDHSDMDDEDEMDDDEIEESLSISNYTVEELEDFMESEEFDQLDENEQYYIIELTAAQKAAREKYRQGGRRGSGGSRDDDNRQFFHTDLRGKKGAERTALGRDPITGTFGGKGQTKIGKHGSYRDQSGIRKMKSNVARSMAIARNTNAGSGFNDSPEKAKERKDFRDLSSDEFFKKYRKSKSDWKNQK